MKNNPNELKIKKLLKKLDMENDYLDNIMIIYQLMLLDYMANDKFKSWTNVLLEHDFSGYIGSWYHNIALVESAVLVEIEPRKEHIFALIALLQIKKQYRKTFWKGLEKRHGTVTEELILGNINRVNKKYLTDIVLIDPVIHTLDMSIHSYYETWNPCICNYSLPNLLVDIYDFNKSQIKTLTHYVEKFEEESWEFTSNYYDLKSPFSIFDGKHY